MSDLSAIDHLVIAGPDLAALSAWWNDSFGAPAVPGGVHTGRGTRNELVGIDASTYIELIGPDVDQPEPDQPRPFGIDGLEHIRLATFAVAVEDLDAAVAAVRSAGVEPGAPVAMQRERPDGGLLAWRLAVPNDPELAGVMPFLIEWGDADHPAGSLPAAVELSELELTHPDAERIAAAIHAATGTDIEVMTGAPSLRASLRASDGPTVAVTS